MVTAKPAALLWQRAAEHPVILVEPTSGLDSQVAAVISDLAAGADGFGLGRLDLLAGLGEEPLGVQVTTGGLVQPPLPAVVLDHCHGSGGPLDLGSVAVGGAQRSKDLPHPALPDPDHAGDIGGREPLAAVGLPEPPELLDPLRRGERAAAEGEQGAAHEVLAHPNLASDLGRVELLAAGDLAGLVELLDPLQRQSRRRMLVGLGAAAVGVDGLQRLQLLRGRVAVADRLGPQASQARVGLAAGPQVCSHWRATVVVVPTSAASSAGSSRWPPGSSRVR